ncbi:sister chromatid cohesion protein PDS5 homolog C-like [Cornus florida]|uniref:sister chromatid cohesion protein PDS5 homolog C-like n=1 Tax=Cornus florida TaxID=4283 RepID=UPI00289E6207|nr:sister chromatid cohesion protein PDS5 homolog C-like [Cornus florida]
MASADKELAEQLMEAGNRLLEEASSVDELLPLLDQVENFLSRVEQSPSKSMQTALAPSLKALVADKLLRHSDTDVKVAVASCISEITRITAPDAPYNDNEMKDVFQLIVSSFENLPDKSSRSYNKRTSILETVAKVRSCVVMLDLECDGLIIEMFQHFLKSIRDYHPENVFSSMETIITLVLEESEDISLELLSPILESLKRDNKEALPIAQKLGERVFENCAFKLKPYLKEAVKSLRLHLDDYSKVIASICEGKGAVEHNDDNVFGEQLADGGKLARTSLEESAQADVGKVATASSDEAGQVAKESMTEAATAPEDVNPSKDRSPKSVMSNGAAETGNEGTSVNPESLMKPEDGHHANKSINVDETSDVEPVDSDARKVDISEVKQEQTAKRRGRKPSSSKKPSDTPQVDSEKETERLPDRRGSRSKEVHSSTSKDPSVEAAVPSENEKETVIELSSPKAVDGDSVNAANPSQSGSLPDENRPKKLGRPKKKGKLSQKASPSTADSSIKASERTSDSEIKSQKRSRTKAHTGFANEDKTSAPIDTSKNEGEATSDSEAKLKELGKKMDANNNIDGSPLKEDGKRRGRGKDVMKSSAKDEGEATSDSEAKVKELGKKMDANNNIDGSPLKDGKRRGRGKDVMKSSAKDEGEATGDSEAKLKELGKKMDANNNIDGSPLKEDGKRRGRGKDVMKSSAKDDDKKIVSSPRSTRKSAKDEGHLEETPKTNSKRKRTPQIEKASDTVECDENLVGSKVKVWWPEDKMFYEGVIDTFDSVKKKHKVLYRDGDEEVLNLKKERWELISGDSDSVEDGEQETEHPSPDASSDRHRKKKAKTNSDPSAKQGKMEVSPKRGGASSSKLKGAAAKSSRKPRDDGIVDNKKKDNSGTSEDDASGTSKDHPRSGKSVVDASKRARKSKDDGGTPKTNAKSKHDTPKFVPKDTPKSITKGAPKNATKSNAKSSKSGSKPNVNGTGKVKSSSVKVRGTEDEKGKSPELSKTPESAKGKKSLSASKSRETGAKSGKKRRRRG